MFKHCSLLSSHVLIIGGPLLSASFPQHNSDPSDNERDMKQKQRPQCSEGQGQIQIYKAHSASESQN